MLSAISVPLLGNKFQDAGTDKAVLPTVVAQSVQKGAIPHQPTGTVTRLKSKDTLTQEKARGVWKGVKPSVGDCFHRDHAGNVSIPEGALWDHQSYLGM